MLYQQGDVLLQSVDGLPPDATPMARDGGRCVLAEGEATGHAHVVECGVELYEHGEDLFCKAADAFTVRHEEHRPIAVPAGVYRVRRVRVYDHFSDESLAAGD